MKYYIVLFASIIVSGDAITNLEQSTINAAKKGDVATIRANLNRVKQARISNNKINKNKKIKKKPRYSLNAKDQHGMTALHWAARRGFSSIATILSKSGADINVQDNHGRTPLHNAALSGKHSIVQILAQNKKLNINKPDFLGDSPLHLAAHRGHEKIVHELIKSGANIDARNDYDKAPYDEARCTNQKECARALIKYGAEAHRIPKHKKN